MKILSRLVLCLSLLSALCLAAVPLQGRYVFSVAGLNPWGHFDMAGVVVLRSSAQGCRVIGGEQDFSMHGFYLAPHFFANGASRSVIVKGECQLDGNGQGSLTLVTGLSNVSVGPGEPPLGIERFALQSVDAHHLRLTETDASAIASGEMQRQQWIHPARLAGTYVFSLHGDGFEPAEPTRKAALHSAIAWSGVLRIDAHGRVATGSHALKQCGVPAPVKLNWGGVLNVPPPGNNGLPLGPPTPAPPASQPLTGLAGPADRFGRIVLELNAGATQQFSLAAYPVDARHLQLVETDFFTGVSGGEAVRTRALAPAAAGPIAASHAKESLASGPTGQGRFVIGYWEDYAGGGSPRLPLRDVSPDFDVIDVIAAEPKAPDYATILFRVDPAIETDAAFRQDVAALQAKGKKVLLTIGGGAAYVRMNNDAERARFVDSVSALIRRYGFNGIDIDFENDSVQLEPGDTDLYHPTSPNIVQLIQALHQLKRAFGPQFMITLVPETEYVQGGLAGYGGLDGSYLPVIEACRDILSFVDVQYYNSAAETALDGKIYSQFSGATRDWSPDFMVAMTETLLHGFRLPNGQFFAPLPASQVAFGTSAVADPHAVVEAMKYLIAGQGFGGRYRLRNPHGYPNLRGVMMWSINIDQQNRRALSHASAQYLHTLPAIAPF
jgi:chitinase